jgi:hypothetical protein
MGRSGFKAGGVHAQNLQAGSITKTLGGSGTDTTSVTFAKVMTKIPKIVVQSTSSKAITRTYVTNKTLKSFTLNIITSTLTGASSFDYIAFDDSYR